MASAYYDQAEVKSDLRITDTGNDTQLDDWSDQIERIIDDTIYTIAKKDPRITSLPVLPLSGAGITNEIKDAAQNGVKMKYYEYTKNWDAVNIHREQMNRAIQAYIARKTPDKQIYGRVIS